MLSNDDSFCIVSVQFFVGASCRKAKPCGLLKIAPAYQMEICLRVINEGSAQLSIDDIVLAYHQIKAFCY